MEKSVDVLESDSIS